MSQPTCVPLPTLTSVVRTLTLTRTVSPPVGTPSHSSSSSYSATYETYASLVTRPAAIVSCFTPSSHAPITTTPPSTTLTSVFHAPTVTRFVSISPSSPSPTVLWTTSVAYGTTTSVAMIPLPPSSRPSTPAPPLVTTVTVTRPLSTSTLPTTPVTPTTTVSVSTARTTPTISTVFVTVTPTLSTTSTPLGFTRTLVVSLPQPTTITSTSHVQPTVTVYVPMPSPTASTSSTSSSVVRPTVTVIYIPKPQPTPSPAPTPSTVFVTVTTVPTPSSTSSSTHLGFTRTFIVSIPQPTTTTSLAPPVIVTTSTAYLVTTTVVRVSLSPPTDTILPRLAPFVGSDVTSIVPTPTPTVDQTVSLVAVPTLSVSTQTIKTTIKEPGETIISTVITPSVVTKTITTVKPTTVTIHPASVSVRTLRHFTPLPSSSDLLTLTPPEPTNIDSNSSDINKGAIAGGVVGGVVGFALVLTVLFFVIRSYRAKPNGRGLRIGSSAELERGMSEVGHR
ncbi:mucin-2 [Ceratobasidium sp. AG-Ba]|nr:mucin-2 [Ceratobasidium sp. AG-Ba]